MESQILQELHNMTEKMDCGFVSLSQRLDGVKVRFDILDERFYKLEGRVDKYTDLTVQNAVAIYELQDAINLHGKKDTPPIL